METVLVLLFLLSVLLTMAEWHYERSVPWCMGKFAFVFGVLSLSGLFVF